MVEVIPLNINSLRYCLKQTALSITRNLWMVLITSGIISFSLIIFGGFLLIQVNSNQLLRNIQSNVEIVIFLKNEVDIDKISQKLDSKHNIRSYEFVSKEQGLINLSKLMEDQIFLEGLKGQDNPLPDLFRVKAIDIDSVPILADEFLTYPEVESVDYGDNIIEFINRISYLLNTFLVIFSIILAFGAIFLIISTIRISIVSRQEEIQIMKYLGASNSFIRFPFILKGMIIGFLGTLLAIIILGLSYIQIVKILHSELLTFFFQPVYDMQSLLPIVLLISIIGVFFGGFGSVFSLNRYLKV